MKKSWDSLYENELSNHASNPQDEGTVWFDDADAERKMVEFLDERTTGEPTTGTGTVLNRSTAAVLDLGCGNGSLLFALRDDGWAGRLLGVDYSERSVQLARAVGVSRRGGGDQEEEEEEEGGDGDDNEKENEREVHFKTWDVLNGPLDDVRATTSSSPQNTTTAATTIESGAAAAGWDLVLDKGTFDAISLSGERDGQGRRICEGYGARVLQLLRTGGLFLVTSCNWTEAELREWFDGKTWAEAGTETETGARLRLAGRIAYPVFSFGGVKGQTISTLCFEKVV
jgi:SAM-dependent methyltransferase